MRILGIAVIWVGLTATLSPVQADGLVASILPTSRSALTDPGRTGTHAVTVFATVINTSGKDLGGCTLDQSMFVAGLAGTSYAYTLTDPATNLPIGGPDPAFQLKAGASQTMVVAVNAISPVSGTIRPRFVCSDPLEFSTYDAVAIDGLDTILFSASAQRTPDVVALSATTSRDGILRIQGNGAGAFAVAVDNVGSGDTITAAVDTGSLTLPLQATLCQTDVNGQCLQPPSASTSLSLAANATATFGVFVQASGELPFRPDAFRIFVRFVDSTQAPRGGTSVAVTNMPTLASGQPVGGLFKTQTPYFDIASSTYKVSHGVLFVSEGGDFQGLNDLGNETAGTLKIGRDLSVSATSTDYYLAEQGFMPVGGGNPVTWTGALSQTGSLYAQRQLALKFGDSPSLANDSQQLFGQFQASAYNRGSSFSRVSGNWKIRDNKGNLLGSITVGPSGGYFGVASTCAVTGTIGLIDQRYDMYRMELDLEGCAGGSGVSSLTGLAIVTDELLLNDTLLFIGNNVAASYNSFQSFTRY